MLLLLIILLATYCSREYFLAFLQFFSLSYLFSFLEIPILYLTSLQLCSVFKILFFLFQGKSSSNVKRGEKSSFIKRNRLDFDQIDDDAALQQVCSGLLSFSTSFPSMNFKNENAAII